MFAAYAYKNGATAANILADLVAIFTGTTNVASLSADCDQPNTSILTTYNAAGWTVHDAAAGTNKVCLKAVCNHDAAVYKYITIDTNTAGFVILGLWQSWNAGTHTGDACNQVPGTSLQQRWSNASTGTLYLLSSARYLAIYGEYGATKGSSSGGASPCFVAETDPQDWQTGTNIPVFLSGLTGGSALINLLYHKKLDGSQNTTGLAAGGSIYCAGAASGIIPDTSSLYYNINAAGQRKVQMWKMYPGNRTSTPASGIVLGSFSDLCSIYWIGVGAAPLDTFTDHLGQTRVCLTTYTGAYSALAFLKG